MDLYNFVADRQFRVYQDVIELAKSLQETMRKKQEFFRPPEDLFM